MLRRGDNATDRAEFQTAPHAGQRPPESNRGVAWIGAGRRAKIPMRPPPVWPERSISRSTRSSAIMAAAWRSSWRERSRQVTGIAWKRWAVASGAERVMGPDTIPGVVELAQFRDPEGNLIGLTKNLATAQPA